MIDYVWRGNPQIDIDFLKSCGITQTCSSQDEAQQLRWAMLLRYKRIIISNEIKNGTPIDGSMLKSWLTAASTI